MRGNFGNDSLTLTTAALKGYFLGLPLLSVRDIANRVYYAYGDTKTPVNIGIFSVFINILLDFILSKYFGVFGITVATSISNSLSAILMVVFLRKYNKDIFNSKFTIEGLVLLAEMVGLILVGVIIARIKNPWLSVAIIGIISVAVEFLVAKIFGFSTYHTIIQLLNKARRKEKKWAGLSYQMIENGMIR